MLDKFGEIVTGVAAVSDDSGGEDTYGREAQLQPEVVTMENVPRLAKHSVFDDFLSALRDGDYWYKPYIVRCADYGNQTDRKPRSKVGCP